jgi:hypothetical protein
MVVVGQKVGGSGGNNKVIIDNLDDLSAREGSYLG